MLSLELIDIGFHYSILSEFRMRLVNYEDGSLLLDVLLKRLTENEVLKAKGQQRTDATAIIGAMRELDQLELVGESVQYTLNTLATVVPEWLLRQVQPEYPILHPLEWIPEKRRRDWLVTRLISNR